MADSIRPLSTSVNWQRTEAESNSDKKWMKFVFDSKWSCPIYQGPVHNYSLRLIGIHFTEYMTSTIIPCRSHGEVKWSKGVHLLVRNHFISTISFSQSSEFRRSVAVAPCVCISPVFVWREQSCIWARLRGDRISSALRLADFHNKGLLITHTHSQNDFCYILQTQSAPSPHNLCAGWSSRARILRGGQTYLGFSPVGIAVCVSFPFGHR